MNKEEILDKIKFIETEDLDGKSIFLCVDAEGNNFEKAHESVGAHVRSLLRDKHVIIYLLSSVDGMAIFDNRAKSLKTLYNKEKVIKTLKNVISKLENES